MPTRADHALGRWTMSFMGWEPLPAETTTLAEILASNGYHTAAMVDTPFYLRGGMNYDKGFQTFSMYTGQEGSVTRLVASHHHESRDAREAWRFEADRNVAQTVTRAMQWLQLHYTEDFFLYIDTWDPHEPWDAPTYYSRLYMPDHDGEVVQPPYGYWQEAPRLYGGEGRQGARGIRRRGDDGRYVDRLPAPHGREHGTHGGDCHHLHLRPRFLLR